MPTIVQTLRLSTQARSEKNVGEIVNLMSVDVSRFENLSWMIRAVWSSPLQVQTLLTFETLVKEHIYTQIIFCLYLLVDVLGGWPVMAGFGCVLVLVVPLSAALPFVQRVQKRQMKRKDDRLKIMSELLNGIKMIKFYAWEPAFEGIVSARAYWSLLNTHKFTPQVDEIRKRELKAIMQFNYLLIFGVGAIILMPIAVRNNSVQPGHCMPLQLAVGAFGTYLLLDRSRVMTAEIAFVSLSLFNIIRWPLIELPAVISFLVQVRVT